MSTLRALRELAEQARATTTKATRALQDATDREHAINLYFRLVREHGDIFAMRMLRNRVEETRVEAQREAYADILAILERPTVEVER